jgi:2',3'-cyclic-nucleotide 2'-phosphodiesterase (5'-nucleotidase family)
MDRKIGEVSYDMTVGDHGSQENGVCEFVADAYRAVGGTQTAMINAASVRNSMEAGTVTYNDVLALLPFSNDVITVRVSGQILLDALEFGVSKLPAGFGGFPQVSGITFRVNQDRPSSVVVDAKGQFVSVAGEYRVSDVMIGQEPLDPKAEYTLTGTSFLLNGGDGYTMFKEADILTVTMLPDNEVVIKYIEEYLDGIIPEDYRGAQGRILIF